MNNQNKFNYPFLSIQLIINVLAFLVFAAFHPAQGKEIQITSPGATIPVSFEKNQGQLNQEIKYFVRLNETTIYLTRSAVVIARTGSEDPVQIVFEGSNPFPGIEGMDPDNSRTHYLVGNNPEFWETNVQRYGKVVYRDIYPGIDVVFYINAGKLEYDFIVGPYADPDQIVLGFIGSDGLSKASTNDLVVQSGEFSFYHTVPDVYQVVNGKRIALNANQVIHREDQVSFSLSKYRPGHPIIIDPVLSFSRYLGGSGNEEIISVTTDTNGNIYVVGGTSSPNMPITAASLDYPADMFGTEGNRLAFIAKLDPSGTRLIYMTYLGGSKTATAHFVRVDSEGNAYLTGRTEANDFPVANPIQASYGGGSDDVFLSKLNPDGSALIYSTYLGGSQYDQSRSMALDDSGSVYLTGRTESDNFPVVNPIIENFSGNQDGFVAKINADGSRLIYSTYLGGSQNDIGHAITVDNQGNAYVTGLSNSPDFPTVNAYQATYRGGDGDDTIIVKLSADGSRFLYSTFIGGSGDDESRAIVVDNAGNAVITGYTRSHDFPVHNALQENFGGDTHDIFVSSLGPDGSDLRFSTYIGSPGRDYGRGLAMDQSGNIYLTGFTTSVEFPVRQALQENFAGGPADAFVMKLDPMARNILFSSYIGGRGYERGRAVTVDASGNVIVTGRTESNDFLEVDTEFSGGTDDAFIIKIIQ